MSIALALPKRPSAEPPAPSRAFNAHLLNVTFAAADGATWTAVGGGESVLEAIAAAREALPTGPAWSLAGWNDLY